MLFFYENRGREINTWFSESLMESAHLHRHVELIYMLEGAATAYVGDRAVEMSEGDLFVALPYQIHDYRMRGTKRVTVVLFPPDLCPEFQNILYHSVLTSPCLRHADRHSRLMRLFYMVMEANDPDREHYLTTMKGLFLALLSEMFRVMPRQSATASNDTVLQDLLTYCTQNYTGDLRLDTLSRELHVNKYYISHLFTQKLHMNFNEYIGNLRISAALPRLENSDESITDIAYSVGFNSARSFNRLFQKHMNGTPRAYRQEHQKNQGRSSDVVNSGLYGHAFEQECLTLLAQKAALLESHSKGQ